MSKVLCSKYFILAISLLNVELDLNRAGIQPFCDLISKKYEFLKGSVLMHEDHFIVFETIKNIVNQETEENIENKQKIEDDENNNKGL